MSLLEYYCQEQEYARNVARNLKIVLVIIVLQNVQKAVLNKIKLQLSLSL